MNKLFFVSLILFAIMAIQTSKLRRSVIYMGIFSLNSSFCYILYSAPDVAIAEAIIGSTLSTILYLVALQKYKVFTIYFTNENSPTINDKYISRAREDILHYIENFCLSKELEPQVVYTTESVEHIETTHQYDLIVRQNDNQFSIYGNKQNYQLDALQTYMKDKHAKDIEYVINKIEEED